MNTLLVEGEADRGFFEVLCRQLKLELEVRVGTPRVFGAWKDTKQAALNILPGLLNNLADGQIKTLAVVLDADNHDYGGGFALTVQQFSDVVREYGYQQAPATHGSQAGLLFTHNDGLNDLGLWVMPNNHDDGMLENWISQCLTTTEQPRFDHAKRVIDELPFDPKFKQLRRPKAEVATWLAWQKRPGEGLYNAVEAGLLDAHSPLHAGLNAWPDAVYR